MTNTDQEGHSIAAGAEEETHSTKVVVELPEEAAEKLMKLYEEAKAQGKPFSLGGFKVDSVETPTETKP